MGLSHCTPVFTPFPLGLKLYRASSSHPSSPLLDTPEVYRKLVGRLLYLNLTRPDVTYGVQQLSQFVSKPAAQHMSAAMHVVEYLKGCPSLGIFFPNTQNLVVSAYVMQIGDPA